MRARDAQGEALRRIGEKSMTRDDVAAAYANCLQASGFVHWHEINQAIIDKWSLFGLSYIKAEAWKLVPASNTDSEPS